VGWHSIVKTIWGECLFSFLDGRKKIFWDQRNVLERREDKVVSLNQREGRTGDWR
jgi:hypothetical protein